jgi:hypothetical protein
VEVRALPRKAVRGSLGAAGHLPDTILLTPERTATEALLEDFARFWDEEPSPLERRKLIATLLDRVWQDGGRIVAVRPRQPFVRYFKTMQRLNTRHGGGVSKTGATGLEPATSGVTGRRSNQLNYAPRARLV